MDVSNVSGDSTGNSDHAESVAQFRGPMTVEIKVLETYKTGMDHNNVRME
jgi:hypothetical protein